MIESEKKDVGFTIMITVYNNVNYIEECLDSFENQNYFKNNDNFQVLVGIDGCERSYKKILEIKDKYRNLEIYNMVDNMGAFVALNTLIPLIKYDNIIVFGSDDVMLPELVEELSTIDTDIDLIRFKFLPFIGNINNNNLISSFHAMGAIMLRKSVFELCGGYHENRFSSDMELLERVKDYTKTKLIDKPLFYYRTHPENLTSTIPLSIRAKFDNVVRGTKYDLTNIKIIPKTNKINGK